MSRNGCDARGICFAEVCGRPEECRGEHGECDRIVTALDLIAAERARQVEALGYSAENDDRYERGELSTAAGAYLVAAAQRLALDAERRRAWCGGKALLAVACKWPWGYDTFKPAADDAPANRIRELTKAGALIVAEIERLQRLLAKGGAA